MKRLLLRFRQYFFHAGLYSLVINVLLLVPSLYMLQVFDRVLQRRSDETLLVLSVGAVVMLGIMNAVRWAQRSFLVPSIAQVKSVIAGWKELIEMRAARCSWGCTHELLRRCV